MVVCPKCKTQMALDTGVYLCPQKRCGNRLSKAQGLLQEKQALRQKSTASEVLALRERQVALYKDVLSSKFDIGEAPSVAEPLVMIESQLDMTLTIEMLPDDIETDKPVISDDYFIPTLED